MGAADTAIGKLCFALLASAVLTADCALADDQLAGGAEPLAAAAPASSWTGFHAGLNAGYGWGVTDRTATIAVPQYDNFGIFVAPSTSRGWSALANSGDAAVNRQGFIGGGQVGYDWQYGSSYVFGVEADIQGADIHGRGGRAGASGDVSHDSGVCITPLSCMFLRLFPESRDITRSAAGIGEIAARQDWLGTARARFGYLVTPTVLVFGSGGLAYGGVQASAAHAFGLSETIVATESFPTGNVTTSGTTIYPAFAGTGHASDVRVGWTAGGGVEWMFIRNWSMKAEALYYDLGGFSVASRPVGALTVFAGTLAVANSPVTRLKFDGVIARAGVNYHFDW